MSDRPQHEGFTPGPWFSRTCEGVAEVYCRDGGLIATVDDRYSCHDTAIANARLIADAPQMYEALKEAESGIVRILGDGGGTFVADGLLATIRAALAAARGEA